MMTKETLGMVVEDDCTIGELRNNRFWSRVRGGAEEDVGAQRIPEGSPAR